MSIIDKINPFSWKKGAHDTTMKIPESAHEKCLFALWDKQLESYGPTIEADSASQVRETFIHMMRKEDNKTNTLVTNSIHFELHQLAKVNKKTGKIQPENSPRYHFNLEELKK